MGHTQPIATKAEMNTWTGSYLIEFNKDGFTRIDLFGAFNCSGGIWGSVGGGSTSILVAPLLKPVCQTATAPYWAAAPHPEMQNQL